jgi:hypothetical protein
MSTRVKIVVVTSYYKENDDILRQCHLSVLCQSYPIAPVPDLKRLRRVRTGWRDFTTGTMEAGCGKALAKERPAALALRRELGYPLPHPVNHGRRAVLDPKAADRSWSPRTSVSAPKQTSAIILRLAKSER